MIFDFLPQLKMGSYQKEQHYINIKNVKKEDVNNINLDFENCESFVVYNGEIKDININFDNQLEWGTGDLYRKVISGYLKIKLDSDFTSRRNDLFIDKESLKITDFERRLCGEKGEGAHDVCHLYIDYYHAGYGGIEFSECIDMDDINVEEESTNEWYECYESGYCKKSKDGSIIIAFGKGAKNTINKICNND